MKTAETKFLEGAGENTPLYHDRGDGAAGLLTTNQGALIWNPWNAIQKGTNNGQRVSDEIYPRGLGIRLLLRNEVNRPNIHYRIIVAVIPKMYNGVITNGSNFDLGSGASGNDILTNFLKKEGVRVLYDKVIRNNQDSAAGLTGANGFAYNRFIKLYIKSKPGQKLTWGEDGNLAQRPVGIWVVPYEKYSTLRSDIIANASYSMKMYYKDP